MEGRHALLPLRRPPCINYCLNLPCISNSVLCHLIVYLCHTLGNRTSYCNPVFKALQAQRRRIGVGERDKCLRRLLRVVGLVSIDSDRCFTRSPRRCSICVDYFFRVFDGIAAELLSAEVSWFHYRHMNSQWGDLDGQALGDAFYGKFRRAIARRAGVAVFAAENSLGVRSIRQISLPARLGWPVRCWLGARADTMRERRLRLPHQTRRRHLQTHPLPKHSRRPRGQRQGRLSLRPLLRPGRPERLAKPRQRRL
jgi:hypothetical protein